MKVWKYMLVWALLLVVLVGNGCTPVAYGVLKSNSPSSAVPDESPSIQSPQTQEGVTVSLVFPNSPAEEWEQSVAAPKTPPFEVVFSLPEGWKLGEGVKTDAQNLLPVFSKTEICNAQGSVVGVVGFQMYEPYEGAEEEPKAIYSQIALGNDYKFLVREEYQVVREHSGGTTALTTVAYAASVHDGNEKNNLGIVSYQRDKHVYIAMELFSDQVTTTEAQHIAKSLSFV